MKKLLSNRKAVVLLLSSLVMLIFAQTLLITKLWFGKDDKTYEINLVKINTQKDSVDYAKMRNDLLLMDHTVHDLNAFLKAKKISHNRIEILKKDSLSSAVYLAKQANRYSQQLVDLQQKLMQVPLGLPITGAISSNFGKRKNPIPYRTVMASVSSPKTTPAPAKPSANPLKIKELKVVYEKDSVGKMVKKIVPIYAPADPKPETAVMVSNKSSAVKPAHQHVEADQIQFHKGMDFAVPTGTDVICTAAGKVIFAGQKGGYGNCVIVSHENGLATLYAHLSDIKVKTNQMVTPHQVIGKSGNSGRSKGPHLHYEVHRNNVPVNPKLFMNL